MAAISNHVTDQSAIPHSIWSWSIKGFQQRRAGILTPWLAALQGAWRPRPFILKLMCSSCTHKPTNPTPISPPHGAMPPQCYTTACLFCCDPFFCPTSYCGPQLNLLRCFNSHHVQERRFSASASQILCRQQIYFTHSLRNTLLSVLCFKCEF